MLELYELGDHSSYRILLHRLPTYIQLYACAHGHYCRPTVGPCLLRALQGRPCLRVWHENLRQAMCMHGAMDGTVHARCYACMVL